VNPFQSRREYEDYVYTLPLRHPAVESSTLVVAQRGARVVTLTGELAFPVGYRLRVKERLTFDGGALLLQSYGYEVWRNSEQLYWYDSQPHPDDPTLAATDPHHKHMPPDIKHHRVAAPGLSFTSPNLPVLIQDIEGLLASS
jgi:hypothetical protein